MTTTGCIRSSRPFFYSEDIQGILDDISSALKEGTLRNGKNLHGFQQKFADYLHIKHAIALDSDSSALETALRYYKIAGKEVVVCTNCFISIPNSVLFAGGKVVFTDIKAASLAMDPASLEACISPKTCGVIVTHISGFPNPDFKEIQEICQKNGLFLIEDATHAMGASVGNQKIGTFGDASVFAFTPTKVLTTGEGGLLATNDSKLAEYAGLYSYYGSGSGKTNFENLGRHMLLPEVSAIIGLHQLARLEDFLVNRNMVAQAYDAAFDCMADVSHVTCLKNARCSYYKYPLTLTGKIDKGHFVRSLNRLGVETGTVFYPPCHLQPVYQKMFVASFPCAEDVLQRTITLPMHAALSSEDVSRVIDCVGQSL
jgi:dTDP-4-amino-4,6-dideoxygalactose transaminase